jgi:hypothetical protein
MVVISSTEPPSVGVASGELVSSSCAWFAAESFLFVPAEWFSALDLSPCCSVASVTWPLLSTMVVPSLKATDLRGLRSSYILKCLYQPTVLFPSFRSCALRVQLTISAMIAVLYLVQRMRLVV